MAQPHTIEVSTRGRGTYDVTSEVQGVVGSSGVSAGLCNVFIHHTSASLIISENADPDVRKDLETFLSRLVKDGDPMFVHDAEGPDDMPSHVRSVLTATSINVPVQHGRLMLGTWQGIYLWEHRHVGHRRKITVTVVG